MISLCSVIYGPNTKYLDYFIDSVRQKCKLVSEIVFCNLNQDEGYHKEMSFGNLKVIEFGLEGAYNNRWQPLDIEVWKVGHSFGMYSAIQRAINDTIYMCDPDIIFYNPVDKIYHELMLKYDLKFIGAAHHIAVNYNCKYFPNLVNLMTRKQYLPTKGFFKGLIRAKNVLEAIHSADLDDKYNHLFDENYLCQGSHPSIKDAYPNPEGISDTGTLLFYWNKHINGNWLSFITPDCHNYSMNFYRNNFKLKERFPNTKLLFHATSGADARHLYWDKFKEIHDNNMLSYT